MKTQGEIEATVCDGVSRFEQEYMGRGPKDIRAHLLGEEVGDVVRAAELERHDVIDFKARAVVARSDTVRPLDIELFRLGHVADRVGAEASGAENGGRQLRLVGAG